MATFLQNMKDPNSDQQKQMDQVLLGGRGQQKRLYAVDENIYGTEEAARLQQVAQQKAKKGKRKKKKKKKSSNAGDKGELTKNDLEKTEQDSHVKHTVVAVAVVGALAAGASLFLGGNRSH